MAYFDEGSDEHIRDEVQESVAKIQFSRDHLGLGNGVVPGVYFNYHHHH